MPALPMTGGCNCGAVRYEVTAELLGASYCHCRRCQRRSGAAASPSAHAAVDSFRVVSGEELLGAYRPEDGFAKVFCSECGSALWSESPTDPEIKGVRFGAFDGDPGIRPGHRQYVAYAAPWEPITDDGLPRYP